MISLPRCGRCRELVILGMSVALLLCVSLSASAQLIEVPPRRTAANLPPPNPDRAGRTYAVTDGCTPTDCTVGGCPYPLGFRVHCMDQGDGWVATASAGTASFGVVNTPGGVSLVAYGAGETLTFAVVPPMSIAGDADTDTVEWSIDAATTSAPGAVQLAPDGGTTAGQAIQASDSRLVNARAPTAHETTHRQGGSDALGGTLAVSITGNAATATDAAGTPGLCLAGSYSRGVLAAGFGATGCTADDDTPEAGDFGALALTGPVTSSGLATAIADDGVALATKTTGDYVSGVTAGGGLTKTGTEGATLGMTPCGVDGQIPKYTTVGGWACAADDGATPGGSGSELQYRATGSALGAVTGSSVSGSGITLTGLFTIGGGSAFNNPDLRIGSGTSGIVNDGTIRMVINGSEVLRVRTDRLVTVGGSAAEAPSMQKCDMNGTARCFAITDAGTTGLGGGSATDGRLIADSTSVLGFARSASLSRATIYGGLDLDSATGGTKPTCDSATRGWLWFTEGGAGVADALEVCRKDAADAYAWAALY